MVSATSRENHLDRASTADVGRKRRHVHRAGELAVDADNRKGQVAVRVRLVRPAMPLQ